MAAFAELARAQSQVAAAPTGDNPPRLALVIGNGAYAHRPLKNPVADARLMARALTHVGFEVTTHLDADRRTVLAALIAFGRKLRSANAIGVFYFAGHGVQVEGRNFVLPVDIDVRDASEVQLTGVELSKVLRSMKTGADGVTIAILDSCRDSPLPSPVRSIGAGLATVVAPVGTLIAYATAPGATAADGDGANSPYTRALASVLGQPGLTIEEVFKETRKRVIAATNGQQVPWEHSS
ncbi:MAG: caspase family protein, partial [Pseudomonadota bacterium]